MSKELKVWYVERNESGDYDVTDYPGYCEDSAPELPDEAELVLKSDFDAVVKERDALCAKVEELKTKNAIMREAINFEGEVRRDQEVEIAKLREALGKIIMPFDCIHCEMSTDKVCKDHLDEVIEIANKALAQGGGE